jgi:hypothetical protein
MAKTRLLICMNCRTIEELSDIDGPPDRDEVLAYLLAKHETAGVRHTGQLADVNTDDWDKPEVREQIIAQIQEKFQGKEPEGLGAETYALMNTLREDAMTCWTRDHARNPNCSDYKSDAKRLAPGTSKERKELGLDPRYDNANPATTRYLCEYCPVHSLVVEAARKKSGAYNG